MSISTHDPSLRLAGNGEVLPSKTLAYFYPTFVPDLPSAIFSPKSVQEDAFQDESEKVCSSHCFRHTDGLSACDGTHCFPASRTKRQLERKRGGGSFIGVFKLDYFGIPTFPVERTVLYVRSKILQQRHDPKRCAPQRATTPEDAPKRVTTRRDDETRLRLYATHLSQNVNTMDWER
jgi:hypothetical protein